jgi:hypothetical protein
MPDCSDSVRFWTSLETLGFSDVPIGVGLAAVVVSLGKVVVGDAPAWTDPDEKPSNPMMPTHPTNAAGARYRPLSPCIQGRTYLRRKRHE